MASDSPETRTLRARKRRSYPSPVLSPSERRQWVDRIQDELAIALTASDKRHADRFLRMFEAEIKYRLLRSL